MTVSRNNLLREQQARCFSFGPDLILHEQTLEDAWPARPNVDAIKEEGLETLLLLNLDTLWPGYSFRLTNKTLNDWEGADIEAEDTAGCRHVFEVKYGAPVGHVVDQALAYALGVLGRSTVRWFADQRTEERELFLACRMAGFWTHTRVDKAPRNRKASPDLRNAQLLGSLIAEIGNDQPLSEAKIRGYATTAAAHLAKSPTPAVHGDMRPHRLAFHIVVPSVSQVNHEQLCALARLRFRSVQASLWEVAVDIDREAWTGKLWLREQWLCPLAPTKDDVSKDAQPSRFPIGSVVASMCRTDAGLTLLSPQWIPARKNTVLCLPAQQELMVPQLAITVTDSVLEMAIGYKVAEHVRTEGWQRKSDPVVLAIARWLLAVAPPPPEVGKQLIDLEKTPKKWETKNGTGRTFRCHHSAEGLSAEIEMDLDDLDCGAIAPIAAKAARSFLEVLNGV